MNPMNHDGLHVGFTRAVTSELGSESVLEVSGQDRREIGGYSSPTAEVVVRPRDTGELRLIVDVARRHGTPLYPVSTGFNWGLGSRRPTSPGCVLLDLGLMNRIRQIDLENGCAIVEPGVTQGALAAMLGGTQWMLNVTGAAAETSIVGNALERGVGYLRQRPGDVLGLEVLTGAGALTRVGGFWPAGHESFRYRHGVGPDLVGLFTQSNFAIVTAAAIGLVHRPEHVRFLCAAFLEQDLPLVVERLQPLYRDGVLAAVARITAARRRGPSRPWRAEHRRRCN